MILRCTYVKLKLNFLSSAKKIVFLDYCFVLDGIVKGFSLPLSKVLRKKRFCILSKSFPVLHVSLSGLQILKKTESSLLKELSFFLQLYNFLYLPLKSVTLGKWITKYLFTVMLRWDGILQGCQIALEIQ